MLWPDSEGVLRALGIAPGMTVLDLCSVDGTFTAPLARIVDGKVYALDIDPEMLDQARAEAARQGVTVAQWICGDARDLATLLPEAMDVVLIANTFHGVPDKTELRMSPTEVRAVVEPAGFEPVDVVELRPYHYGAVFQKRLSQDGEPQ